MTPQEAYELKLIDALQWIERGRLILEELRAEVPAAQARRLAVAITNIETGQLWIANAKDAD